MTFAEVLFIKAELAQVGIISADAKTLYEQAVTAAVEKWGVSVPSGYFDNPLAAYDGTLRGIMEKFTDEDEAWHSQTMKADRSQCFTFHLFRAKQTPGTKIVTVVFRNQIGEEYTQTISMK